MFRSTYGYASSHRSLGAASLSQKAVDFERSIEIFQIGLMGGEDVPFHGAIYCFRSSSKSFPFVYAPEAQLGRVDLARFNKSAWHKSRRGSIQIVAGTVLNVGVDLRTVRTGPRGQLLVDRVIVESLGLATTAEAEEALPHILEALPVIRFDNYGLFGPSPAICISVQADRYEEPLSSRTIDEALTTGKRLIGEQKSFRSNKDFVSHLQAFSTKAPARLEVLFAEILDAERMIFTHGLDSVLPFAHDAEFWSLLRASYEEYYREHCDSFERFLLSVIRLIETRTAARRLFEEGIGSLLGYPGHEV